ncbi:MAG: Unknown protein, partial [uncultured Thiotrichaceae bacterium]
MLVEVTTLAAVFGISYRTWKRKSVQRNKYLLQLQRGKLSGQNAGVSVSGITEDQLMLAPKPVGARNPAEQKREVVVSGAGVAFTALGLTNPFYTLVGLPVVAYASRENFIIAWNLMRRKQVDVETLVSISLLGAFAMHRILPAAMLVFLYRLSTYLTLRVMDDSRLRLESQFDQAGDTVFRVQDGSEIEVPLAEVQVNDLLIVRAGESVPADGIVVEGS